MTKMRFSLFPLLLSFALSALTPLFSAAITLLNDSSFTLKATIISATGKKKGSLEIQPQHTATWTEATQGNAVWSQTPYTVIFTCKSGEVFGTYSNVSPGGTITALSSSGTHYCNPQQGKGQKENATSPPPSDPGKLYIDPNLGPP